MRAVPVARRAPWLTVLLAGLLVGLVPLAGCGTAAYDDDGETMIGGPLPPAAPRSATAVPVVVDTDLAPDDLAAIAYLSRDPDVNLVAITVPATGMVTCEGGVDLLGDLFAALDTEPVPTACGHAQAGPHAVPFPYAWTLGSLTHSGLDRSLVGRPVDVVAAAAPAHIARLADEVDGLQVIALGPLTDLAVLREKHPAAYSRLAGITAMTGVVETASHDPDLGVGEWNAAADPDAVAAVLAGDVPVTVVPDDPVPDGRPAGLVAPVVSRLGMDPGFRSPAFWDLPTAGLFTDPAAARTVVTGTWRVRLRGDRGRLTRTGEGAVRVVTRLDLARLDRDYASVFTPVR